MDKHLNTEYFQNPSNRSGASKVHVHTYTYVKIYGILKPTFFPRKRGIEKVKNQNLNTDLHDQDYVTFPYYLGEKVT
jgi:hypothetical protein